MLRVSGVKHLWVYLGVKKTKRKRKKNHTSSFSKTHFSLIFYTMVGNLWYKCPPFGSGWVESPFIPDCREVRIRTSGQHPTHLSLFPDRPGHRSIWQWWAFGDCEFSYVQMLECEESMWVSVCVCLQAQRQWSWLNVKQIYSKLWLSIYGVAQLLI